MKNLKEKLSTKLSKDGGFTLIEMLIVVAIIAILIAISIPIVNKTLEKARHATDEANLRSAVALAATDYLTNPSRYSTAKYVYYKVEKDIGSIVDSFDNGSAIGQCTDGTGLGCDGKSSALDYTYNAAKSKAKIYVHVTADGNIDDMGFTAEAK